MKKNLIIKQEYSKECGSACLLSIIRYYGGNTSLNHLVELTNTDKNGTNFYNLTEASKKLGLDSKSYKIDNIDKIFEINRPFITQVILNNYTHFVVVYKIKHTKVVIMDPGSGKVIMSFKDFLNIWTKYIMLFSPNKKLSYIKPNNYLKELIVKVIKDNKIILTNILLLSIIFSIMTCLYAFYFKYIIDKITTTYTSNIVIISIIFLIIETIKNISNYSRYELLLYLNQKLDMSIIINTFNKILLLPYNYYKNKTTGETISRINDLASIKNLFSKIIISIFLDLIITISAAIILYNISPKMFSILLVIIIFYILIFTIFKNIIIKLTNRNQENNAKINSFLVENINGIETIKGLHIENIIKEKFSKLYNKSLNENLLYEKTINKEIFLKNIIYSLGTIILIFIGIKEISYNNLSPGLFITFYSLSNIFLEPINNMIELGKNYYYSKNSLKRINNLLEVKSIKFLSNNLTPLGNINIKNLNFSYNNHDLILKDVNINIKNREKILIIGSSGSGKSTLLKILFKYYNVKRNIIKINNRDINDYLLSDIRNNISYISQNEIIYTNTIKNNILLDRKIKYENFINTCNITYINDIVKDKFLGYDTMLEENGSNISGGERQRIILARTLLKKSKILLIDEGFSEIDINTERKILKNIFNSYKDTTFIIVSHRLENMDLYDQVLKIQNGIIENNLTKKSLYNKNIYDY